MANMMACSSCGSQLRVRDEYVGRAMKCPKCGQVMQPGGAVTEVELADVEPVERPRRQARAAAENIWDSGARRPVAGAYAPCPSCGNTDAERVLFTFWGSFHITNMVCHVQCPSCGKRYNGRTGRSNLPVAIVCVLIPLLLIAAVLGMLGWWITVGRYVR